MRKIPLVKCLMLLSASLLMASLLGCKAHLIGMLNPKGLIAEEERKLFFDTLALMLIVVLPVIVMSFTFVYHYRASHRLREYKPNWSHSYFLESLWWGIPCVIIVILAIVTYIKTYELDPYHRIKGYDQPPLLIEAIALPWKWLFIYPEQGIATINYLVLPVNRQVEFWTTADNVPMSAIFIPQLGSQIYTMAGMRTRLHLVANSVGEYEGMNTLYNGGGFSDMRFPVRVVSDEEMTQWITTMKQSPEHLTNAAYLDLLKPTINNAQQSFSGIPDNLFNNVIMLYMDTIGPKHPRSLEGSILSMKCNPSP